MWQPTVSYGELYHHGILGQKWGIRRYQNPDGSLTSAGRKRYGANTVEEIKSKKGIQRRLNDLDQAQAFNKRAYSEARSKNIQLENKKEKMMEARRPNQKKLRKMNNETIKTASEMRKAERYIKQGDKEKEALIKAAEIMGYDVKSKEVNRSVVRGKDIMKHVGLDVLSTTLSAVTGSPVTLYTLPANKAPGTKYKVRDSKALEEKKAAEFVSTHKDPKGTYSKGNLGKKSNAITDAQLKGMSKKEIAKLASADFDGDTVSNAKSKSTEKTKKANGIDAKEYNKITDMAINGASDKEIEEYLRKKGYRAPETKYKVKSKANGIDAKEYNKITDMAINGASDKEIERYLDSQVNKSSSQTKKASSFATIHGVPIYINKRLNEQQVRNMANNLKSQRNWTEEEKEKYIRAHGFSV